jgi:pimeloyl-ACP methyl ester carboxylesterase
VTTPRTYREHPDRRRLEALLREEELVPAEAALDTETRPEDVWLPWEGAQVHIDLYQPQASEASEPVTLLLLHGGGGNGRLLSPWGVLAARAGYRTLAPDLPGHGLTRVPSRRALIYDDWVRLGSDVLAAEVAAGRAVVLFG